MGTKFYDGRNAQYGADHKRIENWDKNAIYPANQYAKVYFRIDCRAYDCFSGSYIADHEPFIAEAKAILNSFDIEESCGYCSGREMPKIEHLYIHPQNISGVVEKRKIVLIAEAINKCKWMSCYAVDVYEDIAPISNEEFLSIISEKRDEIANDIISAFATKRKNLYFGEYSTEKQLERIGNKYSIRRRQCESGTDYQAAEFCKTVLLSMAGAGQIVTAKVKDGTGYRTAKRGELKSCMRRG